jgi:hypothetical protein
MMKTILAALILAAATVTAASADGSPGLVPSFPVGVTVYVTATASTTDVDATFSATKSVKTAAQGATAYAAAKTAAGADASVVDWGLSSGMMMLGSSVETVRVTLSPAQASAARARLTAAGFMNENLVVVARDPDALRAQAFAKATKSARVLAEAAAQGDGRHVGRLLNISPSPLAMLGDLTASLGNVPQVAMLLSGGGSATSASTVVSGYYTFDLQP